MKSEINNFIPIRRRSNSNNRFEFCTKDKSVFLDLNFAIAYPFINGYAIVGRYEKNYEGTFILYGLIDKTGKIVISIDYISIKFPREKLAHLRFVDLENNYSEKDEYYLLDQVPEKIDLELKIKKYKQKVEIINNCVYLDWYSYFNFPAISNIYRVCENKFLLKKNSDVNDRIDFQLVNVFGESLDLECLGEKINIYVAIAALNDYDKNKAIYINWKSGFLNKDGQLLIPFIYDEVKHLYEHFYSIKLGGKYSLYEKYSFKSHFKFEKIFYFKSLNLIVQKNSFEVLVFYPELN